jgi:DNA-binding XRE family transcriptional regulator
MNVYESIMQDLTEAANYQQVKITARKIKLTIKPLAAFDTDDIKRIRQKTGLSQVVFAGSLGVSPNLILPNSTGLKPIRFILFPPSLHLCFKYSKHFSGTIHIRYGINLCLQSFHNISGNS